MKMATKKPTVYDRIRLEALDDREEVRKDIEYLIKKHQELHASKTVLNGLFQFAGSYNIRDLAKLQLHKITYNEEGEFPSIGKSRSGRETKNILVYLKNQEGKIDTYGWDTFEKHIQLFDFSWTTIPKKVAEKGIDAYKEEAQTKAIKEYLTSIDEVTPERIKNIQSNTEKSQVISLLGLEDRIESIVTQSTQSLGSFLGNHHISTVITPEFLTIIGISGSYLKQAEQLNLSTKAQEALARLNDKNLILSNEDYTKDVKLVREETNKKIPHPAKLLIGDYISDFTEIATRPADKQKRFQQGIDLVHITRVLQRDDSLLTFDEADIIWSAFDIPYHRIKNFKETKIISEEYTKDYEKGSQFAKELFIPEGEWICGNKTSPPTRSAFKNIPIIATYKTNGSNTLRSIMKHEQHVFSTQSDEEKTALSRDMKSTREAMDNLVVLARINQLLENKGYDAISENEATTIEIKNMFKNFAEDKQPIERFEQEYTISIAELVNRIETIERESNPHHSRLSERFYPAAPNSLLPSTTLRNLKEAIENKMYDATTITEIKEAQHMNNSVLTQLVNLKKWNEEDTKNYNLINLIKEHPSIIESHQLPWTATKPTTYISPEQSNKLKGFEDLEAALDDAHEWEGMEEVIQTYKQLRNKHQKGYTLISKAGQGLIATKEFKTIRENYEITIDDKIIIIDSDKKEELKEEIENMKNYVPLTQETLNKTKAILSYGSPINQSLQDQGIKHDTKTWSRLQGIWNKVDTINIYTFRNKFLDNFYIEKELVTTIDKLHEQGNTL